MLFLVIYAPSNVYADNKLKHIAYWCCALHVLAEYKETPLNLIPSPHSAAKTKRVLPLEHMSVESSAPLLKQEKACSLQGSKLKTAPFQNLLVSLSITRFLFDANTILVFFSQ